MDFQITGLALEFKVESPSGPATLRAMRLLLLCPCLTLSFCSGIHLDAGIEGGAGSGPRYSIGISFARPEPVPVIVTPAK